MTTNPRLVIGIPLYRGGTHFREALESILGQDFRDLRVVVTDDGGDSAGNEIVSEYLRLDSRLHYVRNERRLGMIFNWRKAFEQARALYPDAPYFAWGSDHDVWHPHWASALIEELDSDPSAVLAYPRNLGIDAGGRPLLPGAKAGFQTAGVVSSWRRLRMAVADMAAGNMVYGLFRADALAACGIYPAVLLPDRLLLAKLALHGAFREVPRTLWYRRFLVGVRPSVMRQRASFFPEGTPAYARLPWWLVHGIAMTRALVLRGEGKPAVNRLRGLAYAVGYFFLTVDFHLGRRKHRFDRSWRRRRKRLRKFRKRVRGTVARRVRYAARAARRSRRRVLGYTRRLRRGFRHLRHVRRVRGGAR